MKTWWLASAALLAFASQAPAATLTFLANLSGAAESPANASPGTGNAVVTFDTTAHTMRVQVDFADLLGTTTASHIHCCTAVPDTGTAGVATVTPTFTAFPLGVTSGTYDHTFDMSLASSYNSPFVTNNGGTPTSAEAALIAGAVAGKAYLNVHSSFAPGGEIRSFLVETPEPGTFAVGAAALGLLVAFRRRS